MRTSAEEPAQRKRVEKEEDSRSGERKCQELDVKGNVSDTSSWTAAAARNKKQVEGGAGTSGDVLKLKASQ